MFQLSENGTSSKAHIYYINQGIRQDRNDCILKQVGPSPYSVTRMEAVTLDTLHTACRELNWADAKMDVPVAKAILCSNYKIWEHANMDPHGSEFIVVLEDDAILPDRELAWQKLDQLLSGRCKDFDYIAVDTYRHRGYDPSVGSVDREFCRDQVSGSVVYTLQGVGAHMQILRRSSLPNILELVRGMEVLKPEDLFWPNLKLLRVGEWLPHMVKQYGKAGTSDHERQLSGCSATVASSSHEHSTILDSN